MIGAREVRACEDCGKVLPVTLRLVSSTEARWLCEVCEKKHGYCSLPLRDNYSDDEDWSDEEGQDSARKRAKR